MHTYMCSCIHELIHTYIYIHIYLLTHRITHTLALTITILMNTAVDNYDKYEERNKVEITDLPDDIFRKIFEFVSIDVLLLLANRHFHAMKGRVYTTTNSPRSIPLSIMPLRPSESK